MKGDLKKEQPKITTRMIIQMASDRGFIVILGGFNVYWY